MKKKQGEKKQSHCYSKREEGAWSLHFLNINDLVFCTLLFSKIRVPYFFKVFDPGFQNKDSGCRLTGPVNRLGILKVFTRSGLVLSVGQSFIFLSRKVARLCHTMLR